MPMSNIIHTDTLGSANLRIHETLNVEQNASEGRYQGERVIQLKPEASLLQDAAEELTFQLGETEEKTLAKRSIGEKNKKQQMGIRDVGQVLEKLNDLRKNVLDRVLQILIMQMRSGNYTDLRQLVRQQLPEPSHQYAALLALAEQLREQGASNADQAIVEAALQDLEQDQESAIRSALNIAEVIGECANSKLGDVQSLRNTYRDAVLDVEHIGQTLNCLVEQYGDAQLGAALDYLIKALGADLASSSTSTDPNKLHAMLNDVYRLEVLTGMLEECGLLVERYQAPGNDCCSSSLLKEILDWQHNSWLRPEEISTLSQKLGINELGIEINLLRDTKELVRMIPLKAYAEPEQRIRLIDTIQQAMDEAINREEELEE